MTLAKERDGWKRVATGLAEVLEQHEHERPLVPPKWCSACDALAAYDTMKTGTEEQ